MKIEVSVGNLLNIRYRRLAEAMDDYIVEMTPVPGRLQTRETLSTLDTDIPSIQTLFEILLANPGASLESLYRIYLCLGSYLSLRGYYLEKKNWGQQLMQHRIDVGLPLYVSLLNCIANAQDDLGEYKEALQTYQFILMQFNNHPTHQGLGVAFYNISRVYRNMGEPEKAIEYYRHAVDIERQYDDKRGLAMSLMGLADMIRDQQQYEEALQLAQEALSLVQMIEDEYLVAQFTADVAMHMTENRSYEEIDPVYREAIQLLQKMGDETGLAKALFNYALLRGKMGFDNEAHALGQQSAMIYEGFGSPLAEYVRQVMSTWPLVS